MSRTTPWGRAGVAGAVVLLLAGMAGCTDTGKDIGAKSEPGSPSDEATEAPAVETVTTLKKVGKDVTEVKRERVKAGVNGAVDPWFDGAFLGDFPRADYAAAFAGFTSGAAQDALGRDLGLLSNEAIADRIDTATATNRRVRVNVFAADGHPRGATAHFVLDFDVAGEVDGARRVTGDLYLAKDKGEWRIFGYDVDQAVAR